MYGMVNKAIEEMVCMHHGEETWEKIKLKAGVDIDVFLSNEGYSDEITYKLVGAASETLNAPAEAILEAFGQHWILHTASEGYGGLMQAGGDSLGEFLINLPNFHSRVVLMFPKLQPPRFECSEVTENSLNLHYFTHRPGLSHFVIGLIQGLGKLFENTVEVQQTMNKAEGADHDIFAISWTQATIT